MSFNIIDQYESFVINNFIIKDKNQIKLLKDLYSTWLISKKKSIIFKKEKKFGAYVYGNVGTGKTFLLNLFCHFTKVGKKIHFNNLMSEIHNSINKENKNEKNLEQFIKKLTVDINILFIDELHIFNIVDALILKKIFLLLNKYKIFLIISSNFHPTELYKNGLQRNDFLPFIDYVLDKFNVIEISNKKDYRRLALNQSKTYFTPINSNTRDEFNKLFERLVDISSLISKTIKTNSRSLIIDRCTANVALCSFDFLCKSNLAHQDYKSIAESFSLIFISDIPEFFDEELDQCRRFISLIDMLYNQNCSVVLLAQKPVSSLCKIQSLAKEFKRTASRLYEMTIIKETK